MAHYLQYSCLGQERETLGKKEETACERKRGTGKGRGKAEKDEAGSGRTWWLKGCPRFLSENWHSHRKPGSGWDRVVDPGHRRDANTSSAEWRAACCSPGFLPRRKPRLKRTESSWEHWASGWLCGSNSSGHGGCSGNVRLSVCLPAPLSFLLLPLDLSWVRAPGSVILTGCRWSY